MPTYLPFPLLFIYSCIPGFPLEWFCFCLKNSLQHFFQCVCTEDKFPFFTQKSSFCHHIWSGSFVSCPFFLIWNVSTTATIFWSWRQMLHGREWIIKNRKSLGPYWSCGVIVPDTWTAYIFNKSPCFHFTFLFNHVFLITFRHLPQEHQTWILILDLGTGKSIQTLAKLLGCVYFLHNSRFILVCFAFYLYRMWMHHQKKKRQADFMELKNKAIKN